MGLKDNRQDRSGRARVKELTLEEKYARLEVKMNLVQVTLSKKMTPVHTEIIFFKLPKPFFTMSFTKGTL
ncbi:hypothetical protein AB3N04_07135 [Alkalihalophilus sp. As8PL]|uniref:Uncharacterized protein n=1 Tax=Alkalihalophilus sp. As8PL TaxID=3237103 RepID=A0AB39BWC5_9BACI